MNSGAIRIAGLPAHRRRARAAGAVAVVSLAAVAASLAALAVLGAAAVPDAAAQEDSACRAGLESIVRNADGSMACVSPSSKAVLIARGWGSEPAPAESGMAGGSADAAQMADDPAAAMADADAAQMADDPAAAMADDMQMADNPAAAMADDMQMTDDPAASMGGAAGGAGVAVAMPDVPEVALTDAESARLAGGDVLIRVAYDPLRIPVEFYDEGAGLGGGDDDAGVLGGVSGGYLDWFDAALPADFAPVDMAALAGAGEPGAPIRPYEAVRVGMADVAMSIDPAVEMRDYMSFTATHTTLPIVMATADESTVEVASLPSMKVGAVSGYGAARWLDATSVDYTEYATGIEAVEALADGEIEVFVGLWAVASYVGMMMDPPMEVTNAGETGQSEMLSVGYAASDAPLGSALEKALASVPDDARALIATAATDPLGALTTALSADEAGSAMLSMAEEIDELNSVEGEVVPQILALPEAVAFAEKHPKYDPQYYGTSFEAVEMVLVAEDKSSLRIEYSLVDEKATSITYNCYYPDGTPGDSYMDADLAEKMPTLCVP